MRESRVPPTPDSTWLCVGQVRVQFFPGQGSSVDMSTCCVCISERAVGSVVVGRQAPAASFGAGEMAAFPPSRLRGRVPMDYARLRRKC